LLSQNQWPTRCLSELLKPLLAKLVGAGNAETIVATLRSRGLKSVECVCSDFLACEKAESAVFIRTQCQ
jgi:hypothetical protein